MKNLLVLYGKPFGALKWSGEAFLFNQKWRSKEQNNEYRQIGTSYRIMNTEL
jgi:hypothetical protein